MRFDTNNASSFLVWQMEYANVVQTVRDEGDILLLTLKNQQQIMVHLIERNMSLSELQYHFRTNTANNLHTLMIFWVDMLLPRDGSPYTLPDWLATLSDIQGNKVYGYEVAGRNAYFFPVHLEGTGQRRTVRYGHVVDYAQIGCTTVASNTPHLSGTWYVADFEPRGQRKRTHTTDEIAKIPDALLEAYQLLGLPPDAHLDTIKATYRTLARRHHPDVNPDQDTHHRMKQLNRAYQRIMQAHQADRS